MPELNDSLAWLVLVAGGACETIWAQALAATGRRPILRILQFCIGLLLSLGGLAWALMTVEVATAYAVWIGVGALTTIAYSVIRGHERLTWLRALFIACLLGGAVGLKAVGA